MRARIAAPCAAMQPRQRGAKQRVGTVGSLQVAVLPRI